MIRVLVADRNVRLLESISLTFVPRYHIHTASTRHRCAGLLQKTTFDLVIIGEKLADGPGLPLLGQVAQLSPGTLRVFAARHSTLRRLAGRLGPFGLLSTLPYPIDAGSLLSTLTLAQARSDASHSQAIALILARLQRPRLIPPRLQPPQLEKPRLTPPRLEPPQLGHPHALARRVPARHQTRNARSAGAPPKRSRTLLAATAVAIFLLTTLTLRQLDAAAHSSSVQAIATPAVVWGSSALHSLQPRAPDTLVPSSSRPVDPKPAIEISRVAAPQPQAFPDNTPIADPSTFGSEAAEPIYSN